ncbi:unnamed protein product [Allacma fusca]|uniref:Dynein axonemal assembly factor 1 homolog n=1 Tax=Allacma fusca TaxID=39272 RepID=A0A8J2J249_9HEXA|nr:unnamed protein product [Allacma fusca]
MPRQKVPPPEVTNRKNLLHKEPSVINNEMIVSSLEKLLPSGDEGKIANLSHMTSLTKLQLCNNILTKIEKLDTLVNLVWLDLSFNSIRKIENLGSLKKLECINLHRNLITHIENMDNQLRLEIFIISSNGVRTFDQIQYLRRFVRLRSVNFDGNPITNDLHYRAYSVALLPQITLLDYVRITNGERASSERQFGDRLAKIAAADEKLRRRASVVEADEAVRATYALAFVDGFDEDEFWKDMYDQDSDGKVVLMIGDTDDLQSMYHELFRRASRDLFDKGMVNYSMRENEIKAFNIAIKEEKNVVTAKGRKLTEEFVQWSKEAVRTMRGWVNLIDDLEREVGSTNVEKYPEDKQMGLHEQISEVNQELDRALRELVTAWLEQLRGYFGVLRDIQLQFNDRIVEDLVTYGNFRLSDTSLPENYHYLLQDKEALGALVQASHENHNTFIDMKEERMVSELKKWMDNAVTGLGRDETHRNRMRVSEISHFIDIHRKVLEDKHIINYATCYVPETRADQKQVSEEEEENSDSWEFKLSKIRISNTLLNLAKLDANAALGKGSVASGDTRKSIKEQPRASAGGTLEIKKSIAVPVDPKKSGGDVKKSIPGEAKQSVPSDVKSAPGNMKKSSSAKDVKKSDSGGKPEKKSVSITEPD